MANVENGQLVTVRVGWCTFGASTEIFGIVEKAETSTSKYGVEVASFEHGTATADKTEYAYGEKVTLTVAPETGYIVDTIEARNAQKTTLKITKEENKYSFDATCVNNVTITLKNAADTKTTVIWDCSSKSAPSSSASSDTEYTATVGNLGVKKFGGMNVKQNNGYIMMYSTAKGGAAQDSYFYSKEALPGSIVSISLTTSGGASPATTYAVHFGAEMISQINKEDAVNVGTATTQEFACTVENAKYFQIAIGNTKNGQISQITIVYDTTK